MTDNQLIQIFGPIIAAGLTAAGYSGVEFKQGYQPTQQGAPTTPTVFYNQISYKRCGYLKRDDVWNPDTLQMDHIESQTYEGVYQINALAIQNPSSISYTAGDLVNSVASIMQSDATRATLLAAGVSTLRIMDIRNPQFVDDKDRFEASPSFDFTLIYDKITTSISPVVESIQSGIYRV